MTTDAHDLYVEAGNEGTTLVIKAWSRSGRSIPVALDYHLVVRIAHYYLYQEPAKLCAKTYRQADAIATSELHNLYAQGRLRLSLVGDHWEFD